MKKYLAMLLACLLILTSVLAQAEGIAEASEYDKLVVGSTTRMSGNFFSDMFGSNTADLDVRDLLHGYNLVEWKAGKCNFGLNESVVSGMIATMEANGDKTYHIVIYDDLYYSDGTQITAKDYAFSILLSMAAPMKEIGAKTDERDYIVGAAEYRRGESYSLRGVRLTGEYQLDVTIRGEYLPFFYEYGLLNCVPYPVSVIVPGCEVEDTGWGVHLLHDADFFNAETLRQTVLDPERGYLSHPLVTSGPYRLLSWDGVTAEFEINPYYKGNSDGVKPRIQYLVYTLADNADMIQKLEDGELGLLNKVTRKDAIEGGAQLVFFGDYDQRNYPRNGASFIYFCCEQSAAASQAVRQAIAYCIDREELAYDYVKTYGLTIDGYYGIGQWMVQMMNSGVLPPMEEPGEDAAEAELIKYEEQVTLWDSLNLDSLTYYYPDVEQAIALLEQDGWVLNRAGGAFDPAADDVRCKRIGGELVALDLNLLYPAGNAAGALLKDYCVDYLAQAGIKLTIEPMEFTALLELFYNREERGCDMIYMATNFDMVFDPSANFQPGGIYNYTQSADERLYELAQLMRRTEPDDVVTYVSRWVDFQEYFSQALPAIPLYSNIYYDFFTATLHDYEVSNNKSWAEAIIPAIRGDVVNVLE